jgi:hypothetical protein
MDDDDHNVPPQPLDYAEPERPAPVSSTRRVVFWALVAIGTFVVVLGVMQSNPAARVNIALGGFTFIVLGLLIRFRDVRF